jgi:class 3 adenylate cyclase
VRAENAAGEDTVISRLAEDRTLAGPAASAGATWETAPDGTVTILFSDIEGSTALNVELGDQRWMQLLREHQALVRREIGARGGYEVKTEGDGFMLAFRSARDALHCAIAMQRAFAQRNDSLDEDGTPINVRVGLHTGEPVAQGDDFYGVHVVMAARIADQASGGEILVSTLLRELVEASGEFEFESRDPVVLKGLSGSHTLHTVVWNESEGQ